MKVLHVAHGYAPECSGGIETHLASLLPDLEARGHRTVLVAGSHTPWEEVGFERESVEGIEVLRLHRDDLYFDLYSRLRHPGAERVIDRILEAEAPDLVHVHSWIRTGGNWVELAARRGTAVVVTLHDLYPSCPRCFRVTREGAACLDPMRVDRCRDCAPRFGHESVRETDRAIELFARQYESELSGAAKLLVADGATRDVIAASTGIERAEFEVLPFPTTPRFAGVDLPDPEPGEGEAFRFGYWGSITDRKGLGVLVDAFRAIAERAGERPLELHLFGKVDTDALRRELEAKAEGLAVRFHGRFEYEELAATGLHAAVFPMLCFETYGFVLDECFELGLPAIVTDLGSMTSRAGKAALRVAPGSVDELAAAMERLAGEPDLRAELRANIRPLSLAPEAYLDRMEAIYAEAKASGPRPFEPVDAADWAELFLLQRESALRRGLGPDGPR